MVLAFVDQVFIQWCNLNYLFALPACGQHRALFPVMDIDWFFIEVFVKLATKVATFLIQFLTICVLLRLKLLITLLRTRVHRLLALSLHFVLIGLTTCHIYSFATSRSCSGRCATSSSTSRVDVCLDNRLLLGGLSTRVGTTHVFTTIRLC